MTQGRRSSDTNLRLTSIGMKLSTNMAYEASRDAQRGIFHIKETILFIMPSCKYSLVLHNGYQMRTHHLSSLMQRNAGPLLSLAVKKDRFTGQPEL